MTEELFPTIVSRGFVKPHRDLLRDIQTLSRRDRVGRDWSRENYRGGYTSYASLSDLHRRTPAFSEFADRLDPHVRAFVKAQGWKRTRLEMTNCWMNIMPRHTYHTLHLHPHSVVSGVYYVSVPKGSVALKLEDPRMSSYMNAPTRALYHEIKPKAGMFVLFESWLRHEVPPNQSSDPRISISFNYSFVEA
jgi:uncharacterized protein (TIGR02466 family)